MSLAYVTELAFGRTDGQIGPWIQQRLPQSRRADCLEAEGPAANIAEEPGAHNTAKAQGRTDGQTDRRTDGQTDRRTDGQIGP